jgi:hypothetical protein
VLGAIKSYSSSLAQRPARAGSLKFSFLTIPHLAFLNKKHSLLTAGLAKNACDSACL